MKKIIGVYKISNNLCPDGKRYKDRRSYATIFSLMGAS